MVKTLPFNTQGTDVTPRHTPKSPHASWLKIKSIKKSNITTHSIKALKMIYIQKNLKKKIGKLRQCYFMSHLCQYI